MVWRIGRYHFHLEWCVQICYERHTGKALGYAVVHFDNPAAAQYAIDMLHNAEVDGRHIVVAPYCPRVSDSSAPNAWPRPPSRPAANEAVALVMDLNKNATWMCGFHWSRCCPRPVILAPFQFVYLFVII